MERTMIWVRFQHLNDLVINPFTAMIPFKTINKSTKFEILKPFLLLSFSHWHVNGIIWKRPALKGVLGVCTWVVVLLCYKLLTVTGKFRQCFRSAQWPCQPTRRYLCTCSSLSCRMPPAPPALESHNATSYHHRHWNHAMQLHITTGTGITQCNFISPPALEHTIELHITTGTGNTQCNFISP